MGIPGIENNVLRAHLATEKCLENFLEMKIEMSSTRRSKNRLLLSAEKQQLYSDCRHELVYAGFGCR